MVSLFLEYEEIFSIILKINVLKTDIIETFSNKNHKNSQSLYNVSIKHSSLGGDNEQFPATRQGVA